MTSYFYRVVYQTLQVCVLLCPSNPKFENVVPDGARIQKHTCCENYCFTFLKTGSWDRLLSLIFNSRLKCKLLPRWTCQSNYHETQFRGWGMVSFERMTYRTQFISNLVPSGNRLTDFNEFGNFVKWASIWVSFGYRLFLKQPIHNAGYMTWIRFGLTCQGYCIKNFSYFTLFIQDPWSNCTLYHGSLSWIQHNRRAA